MKIIQLIQKPQLRGAEIFACQLSNHLVELGNEVIVVSIFSGVSVLPFKGEIINLNRSLSRRFYDFQGWKLFKNLLNDFKPDIIQANAADTLKFAVSSKLLFKWNTPIVFRNANKMGDFINSSLKWNLNNFYLSKVSYVISVSKECEIDFISTFNFPAKKIITIEIGVEDKEIGDIPTDFKLFNSKGPLLAHIGGFVPEKNHSDLILIFVEILKEYPKAQLFLIGKGRLEDATKIRVKELKIHNNVHFLGYRNDVLEILKNVDVFVLPSLIEGLPGVILESMYVNTPVVAYNVGGVGEVVRSGETGWLIKKDDRDSFKKALMQTINETELVNNLTLNAKNMVLHKFLNSSIAMRFQEVYKQLK